MTDVITKIQNNIYINAFKNAINKVAFLNIGIAFFVLILKITERFINVNENISFFVEIFYLATMIFFGLILIMNIVDELMPKKDKSLKMTIMFMSFLSVTLFISTPNYLPVFPIFGSVLSFILVILVQNIKFPMIKEKLNVPKAATDFFNSLIPIFSVMISGLFPLLLLNYFHSQILFGYLKVISLMSSLITLLLIVILICLFWYLGLHGVAVVSSIMRPFWFQMLLFNTYYAIMDVPLPYIGTETFLQWFVWLGGSGATLGLALSLRYFARSKELKELGVTSFNSSIHNINEGVIFGVPIMQNKYFRIPFFVSPIVLSVIGYSAIKFGYVANFAIVSPWVLPVPFGSFISSLGSFRTMLLTVILIIVSWLIYFPFFRVYDSKLLEQEKDR